MYLRGFRSVVEAEALRFGTLIHTALEAWWLAPAGQKLAAALATLPLDGDPFELIRAAEMLRGYDIRWADEPLEALAVESEFRAPLINPATGAASRTFELGGKIDVIVLNHADDRVYFVEHKTSSDDLTLGSQYWQLLRLDTQVSTYYAGLRALGHKPAGVIYDVLGKPKLRPLAATPVEDRKYVQKTGALYANQRAEDETPAEYNVRIVEAIAEAPDRYFVRGDVVRLEDEEREAQWDAWNQTRMIRENELAKRFPRNPDSCRRFGRMCSFFDVCTGAASLDDERQFRRVENVHEELTEAPHADAST